MKSQIEMFKQRKAPVYHISLTSQATWKGENMRKYFLKQKLIGLVLIICGILAPVILDGDATVSVLFLPLGAYLIFTRNCVIIDTK